MNKRHWIVWALLLPGLLLSGSVHGEKQGEGFEPLFDGESLSGWVDGNGNPMKPGGWVVQDGMLHLKAGSRPGNLFTEQEYGDFVLEWEWKIEPGGNNGLKYRVRKYGKTWLGPEYQMIDDSSDAARKPYYTTAAIYNLYAPAKGKPLNPPGEWNASRIVVEGTRFVHYLNGVKVTEADTASGEWQEHKRKSKFAKVEGFAENATGKIMLTDHNDAVWYRNIRIKPLNRN